MSSASGSGGVNLISSFLTTVKADLDSPVTSNFGSRIFEYRSQVSLKFIRSSNLSQFENLCLFLIRGVTLVSSINRRSFSVSRQKSRAKVSSIGNII